ELRELLSRPDLEQLNQRITVRWHLGRLDRSETEQYVAHRVRTAGQTRSLFTRGAIAVIHSYSRGIPRLINVACHRSLRVASASAAPGVSGRIARRAITELRRPLPVRATRRAEPWVWAGVAAAVAAALTAGGLSFWPRVSGDAKQHAGNA